MLRTRFAQSRFFPVVAATVAVTISSITGFDSTDNWMPTPSNPIRIAKETTYVLGPTRTNGDVDFPGALNARSSRGVTTENNAVVLLAAALGPVHIQKPLREEFFGKLGIPVPAQNGRRYFLSPREFARQHGGHDAERFQLALQQEQRIGSQQPWSREDLPKLAAWLDYNKEPLKLIKKAITRKRWYLPIAGLSGETEDGMLLSYEQPFADELRPIAIALSARALLSVSEDRAGAAVTELIAVHHLARLVANGHSTIDYLRGCGIESIAVAAGVALLTTGKIPTKEVWQYQERLAKLPPFPTFAERVNVYERLMLLDTATVLAKTKFDLLPKLSNELTEYQLKVVRKGLSRIDWNMVLKGINLEYDRLHQALIITPYSKRRLAMVSFDKALQRNTARFSAQTKNFEQIINEGATDPSAISSWMAHLILKSSQYSLVARRFVVEPRRVAKLRLLRLAVALERFRMARGHFPDHLVDLQPTFMKTIENDPFSDQPFIYRPGHRDYSLYSVGPNGVDDNRGQYLSSPEHDDLVVQVILPAS